MQHSEYILSKKDIANYLYDYYFMIFLACGKSNASFWDIFCDYMGLTNRSMYINQSYYYEMANVFSFYLIKTIDSILFDANFKDIDSDMIDINEDIFVNKEDAKMFSSKKQILKLMRNAINHNNNDSHETYVIKRINGKLFIEINLLDVRTNKEKQMMKKPKPFHVLLSFEKYFEIMSRTLYISNNKYTFINIEKDLTNLKSNNCYSLLDSIRIRKCYPSKDVVDAHDSIQEVYETYPYKEYKLNKLQKLKIKEDLEEWEKLGSRGFNIIQYLVTSSFPLPEFRRPIMEVLLYLTIHYVGDCSNKSLSSLKKDTQKMIVSPNRCSFKVNECLEQFSSDADRLCAVCDWDLFAQICCFIYCGYIFDTVVTDDEVIISDRAIPRNKLRNAFVHSRWAAAKNGNFQLFDWQNDPQSEYNKNIPSFWSEFISWEGLQKAAQKYHDKISKDSYIDFPIQFNKDLSCNSYYSSLSFVKNGVLWIINITNNYNNEKYLPWGIYCANGHEILLIDDEEKIEYFLNEMHNVINMTDELFNTMYSYMKAQNKITRDYKKNLISKDELIRLHDINSNHLEVEDKKMLVKE